ncbi:MAG: amidohydrolase [Marmoricola sp.]
MSADLVFLGGAVRTGVAGDRATHALAVEEGRITAVGDAARSCVGPSTRVVDLAGGALVPGFGDGHVHPLLGGLGLLGVPVRDCTSVEQIIDAVRAWADAHPEAEWICGSAFSPWLADDGLFDARWLDEACSERPVVLRTMDHHTAWVNSEALRRAALTADTPDPPDGEIVRRADGGPLGTLREWGAFQPVLDLIPAHGLHEQVAALRRVSEQFARHGITWVQDAFVSHHEVPAWLAAASSGALSFRADLAFLAGPSTWSEELPMMVADRSAVEDQGRGWLSASTVKFFADGVIESGTAAMIEDYHDCPHSRGMLNWSATGLAEAMAAVDDAGFDCHIHAIGDAGIRASLDAIEEVRRRNGHRDRRTTIAHLQVIDPADLPRFAELGVVANFQPLWAQPDPLMTELTQPRLGAERSSRQYQINSMLASGAAVSFGSDWPVTSFRPLEALRTAVARQTRDGLPAGGWLPEERVDVDDALRAYTAGVAYQAREEGEWGALRPGMRADLVHLSADPLAPDTDLSDLQVLGTWLAGTPTFQHSA